VKTVGISSALFYANPDSEMATSLLLMMSVDFHDDVAPLLSVA